MKILYIATFFPEPAKGATIYTDLAEALHEAGHGITVAVAEQAGNMPYTGMKKERGFDVLRIITGNYYNVGFIKKGITTLKIPFLMRSGIKKYVAEKAFDLILFESPPVTNAGLVAWAKKHFKCPAYLMLKDIFPQNAADLGIIKQKSPIFRYFSKKEKQLYRAADYIGCMSAANKQYIIENNPWLSSDKLEIFPNTKRITDFIWPNSFEMRRKYGIPEEACVFLFGGNMGRPQYIDLLGRAVKSMKNEPGIFFLFIGRGTDRYKLEQIIKGDDIKNALVIEDLPRNEYEEITKECDVGLIVLDPRFTIPNYPSRILSYMECAKPVLAATDMVTDIKGMIEEAECGEWVWSGDAVGFEDKVRKMAHSKNLAVMGMNGRKYLEDHFNVKYSVEILEKHQAVQKAH